MRVYADFRSVPASKTESETEVNHDTVPLKEVP